MKSDQVLHEFRYVGSPARGRAFPGFPSQPSVKRFQLAPREPLRLSVCRGDLLSLTDLAVGDELAVWAFDSDGKLAPACIGIDAATSALSYEQFDAEPLSGWLRAHGLEARLVSDGSCIKGDGKHIVLEARQSCEVWFAQLSNAFDLVSANVSSATQVSHQTASSDVSGLPPPLGQVKDEFTVDRGSARAYQLAVGDLVQIIDVEGQQCSDFMAFRARGLDAGVEAMIDSTTTRSMVRGAYPQPGLLDKFFDAEMRPMLAVVQDTCGRHDTFGVACTARSYEERGFPGHRNCSDNISFAASPYGVKARAAWPAVNFFWSTWIDAHSHALMTEESWSRPGDYVAMRALDDLVCVTTACPDDLDPINGWNPTDVHVRIYKPDTAVRRAVAYRMKEDSPMAVSRESAFHTRTEKLTSHFAPARDLWLPMSYPSVGTAGEYWACREKVALQDMSSLRKYDIVGPDAEKLLQRVMTRDIARLAVWRGTYSLMCDETGNVIDDGTLFRLAPDIFRWCCGSEESARALREEANANGWQVRLHEMGGALPNLALQGPRSRDVLRKLIFTQPTVPSLDHLRWFGATVARTRDREGIPFLLTRTGYTGELGYELFCSEADAVGLWDAVMEAGQEFGIEPMGAAALDIIRIEAGLAAANAEFAPGVDAFEAGLGFAVAMNKEDFIGKAALERNQAAPRRVLKALLIDCDDAPAHGAQVFNGERPVGVVTSATRSPTLRRGIAMARLAVEFAHNDTMLEVGQLDGRMKRLSATVSDVPFIDPKRTRARA